MMNRANIMGIDTEDWYQDLKIDQWHLYEDRIVESTNTVLRLLKETGNRATFFVLGWVAERFPELISIIKDEHHEVASHGYAHVPITEQTPEEFEDDLVRSLRILEAITGEKVLGFRAPFFTVGKSTSWAIAILKRNGLVYDSSIFPVKTHMYGVPDAPLSPYHISSTDITAETPGEDFLEIPLSVYCIPAIRKNLPIAGGFYLRFLPYFVTRHCLKQITGSNRPAVCYLHPWEVDPGHPRIDALPWYHYYRLSSTEGKLRKLLTDFRFISVKEYLGLA